MAFYKNVAIIKLNNLNGECKLLKCFNKESFVKMQLNKQ